jgi:hypothetical protein
LRAGLLITAFSAFVIFLDGPLMDVKGWAVAVVAILGALTLLCVVIIVCQPQNSTTLNFKVSQVNLRSQL